MKFLRRAYFTLLYALPAVLFCSYYPVIRLGSSASMNFELSLPLIWLVLFDLTAFVLLIASGVEPLASLRTTAGHDRGRGARHPQRRADATAFRKDASGSPDGISDRKFFLFALFPLYATLSIFWSGNTTRAILTAGIIWLVFFAIFAIIYLSPRFGLPSKFRSTLIKVFFISSILICVVCWAQCIFDVCGITREHTLLCAGCISQSFGFPHPSGLAIEPQFMGNLLLAPTFLSLWILTKRTHLEKTHRVSIAILAFLFSSTLFLTFSRGAIYAFAAALVILLIFAIVRHKFRPALIIIPVFAFIFTLIAQGTFSVIGPMHETFIAGVTKSIHQLSLGIIDLRPREITVREEVDQVLREYAAEHPSSPAAQPKEGSKFDGYVAESTDIRLSLNAAALDTWLSAPGHYESNITIGLKCSGNGPCNATILLTPTSILFGVGLGGAGTALYANRSITGVTTPKEIVQNQPLSLLLELGLVGVVLIIFSLLLAFCPQIFPARFVDGRSTTATKLTSTFWQHPALPLLLALIIAYVITLQFFSGLPNALQIYLIPPLLYLIFQNYKS